MFGRLKTYFRAPEAKDSRTAQLVSLQSGGRARWTPRDYAALAREGYMKNAIVHRAVRLVAENVGSVTWLLFWEDLSKNAEDWHWRRTDADFNDLVVEIKAKAPTKLQELEQPIAAPLPAAVWMALSTLGGIGTVGLCRKRRPAR